MPLTAGGTGLYDLYIGYPFVVGQLSPDIQLRAPLLLFPAHIHIEKDEATLTLTPNQPVMLNKAFVLAYAKEHNVSTDKLIQEFDPLADDTFSNPYDVADYLNALYEQQKIPAVYLANRIDLLNPYLSHTGINTVVDYREQTTVGSQLKYSSELIVKLASQGVVFDLVEGREKYYEYDNTNYSGIEVTTSDGKVSVTFLDTGDSAHYLDIKENVAYLNFKETFSTKTSYAQAFDNASLAADRAVLDWYLYTVNGSDYTSVGKQGNAHPMLDGYNRTGVTSGTSVVKYGVSAWTPTVYLRAVRGVEYKQARYTSSTESAYTLSDFQAENFQVFCGV